MAQPGDRIERWSLVRRLGSGGQAEVFEAHHVEIGSRAALKVIHQRASAERLVAEGRMQAKIDHPNVVRVIDVLRVDDRPVLVMEFIEGPTFGAWLAVRPRGWEEVAPVLAAVLAGVEAAHRAGLVHRDLKPSNVLVAQLDGALQPKIVDFGIARDEAADGGTRTGTTLGTPRYMAPEQLRHVAAVDARADVWALGGLIFEAATGRSAFDDADPITLHQRFTAMQYPDPAVLAPGLPTGVVAAIRGALEPNLARRIPDVATLRRVLAGEAWSPPASPPTWADGEAVLVVPGFSILERGRADAEGERWTAKRADGVAALVTVAAPGEASERLAREGEVLDSLRGRAGLRVAAVLDRGVLADGRCWLARAAPHGEPLAAWAGTRRTKEEIARIIADALDTAAALHALSPPILVRDWSPACLTVVGEQVWVTDLGRVRDRPVDPALGGLTFDGQFGYLAPEQLEGDSAPATDVWVIGALAAGLFARHDPGLMRDGLSIVYARHVDLPASWRACIDGMLSIEAGLRPSAAAAARQWRALLASPSVMPEVVARSRASSAPAAPVAAELVVSPVVVEARRVEGPSFDQPPIVRPAADARAPSVEAPAPPRKERIGLPAMMALTVWFLGLVAMLAFGAFQATTEIASSTIELAEQLRAVSTVTPPVVAPPVVAPPVVAPKSADLSGYSVRREGDVLTVQRRGVIVAFDQVPLSGTLARPLVGPMPKWPATADETCLASVVVGADGAVAGVQVRGCSEGAAAEVAGGTMRWQYAPSAGPVKYRLSFRFSVE